ncbi:SGNH/GDSL hydrolase family protein [Silvanigrella aquatica]|uniref:SGNH hydrolase-type esterase domain-containing protein n=1 Tax=Silvanigrella aquatica TaxID=1915309 RepID=A0A1L4D028_9BACT|nr:SGNH/GDSL hydrolase family protein [Silvanigrella aquatica]APJ03556.1 hypothetical protein AXG55_06400 [Silvanigrella aquatica]
MLKTSSFILNTSLLMFTAVTTVNLAHAQEEDQFDTKFVKADYNIACYYYDTNNNATSDSPSLMLPSTNILTMGAKINYYWSVDSDSVLARKTILTGKIIDGFFVEENLSYADIENRCKLAIKKGTFLSPSKSTYKLYEFKASTSSFDGYEYPIQFLKGQSTQTKIKKVVIFGDSLSDNGNLKRWTKIFPYYPFWHGRFADGMVWNDYFTDRTHLPILNFAVGGSKTEGSNDYFLEGLPNKYITGIRNIITGNSKQYIDKYLTNYLTSDSYETKNTKISNSDETLFVIWIGANDYLEKFENQKSGIEFFENPDEVGHANYVYKRTVNNIIDQIKILHNSGAKQFVVMNLPDIGKSPVVYESNYNKYSDDHKNKNEFSSKLTELINKHNFYLRSSLKLLQDQLGNTINIQTIDIDDYFSRIMNNESFDDKSYFNYGFDQINTKYLIPGNNDKYLQDLCYRGGYFKAAFTKIGPETVQFAIDNNNCVDKNGDRNKLAIFWNSPHPTSYAQCWIGYAFEKKLGEVGLVNVEKIDMPKYMNYCISNLKK